MLAQVLKLFPLMMVVCKDMVQLLGDSDSSHLALMLLINIVLFAMRSGSMHSAVW